MAEEKKSVLRGGLKALKWLIWAVIGLVVIIAGGVYYAYNYYDWQSVVRKLVHQYGSAAVGTDVRIGGINLSLKNGSGSVGSITVANPKGYKQDYIIKLGSVSVSVDKNSVKKLAEETLKKTGPKVKTIVINEIRVDKPEVTYELMSLQKNNVDDILANIKKNTASSAKPQKAEEKSDTEYNVAIKKVVVANGVATVAADLLGSSESLSLNLPTITVSNLGTEKQGITIEDGLARIFQEILNTTTEAVSKADLSGIINGIGDVAGAAVDTAGKAAEAAVDTAGKAADATVDAAGNAAEAAADTAGKAADAAIDGVAGGVKSLTDGIGGMF